MLDTGQFEKITFSLTFMNGITLKRGSRHFHQPNLTKTLILKLFLNCLKFIRNVKNVQNFLSLIKWVFIRPFALSSISCFGFYIIFQNDSNKFVQLKKNIKVTKIQ